MKEVDANTNNLTDEALLWKALFCLELCTCRQPAGGILVHQTIEQLKKRLEK